MFESDVKRGGCRRAFDGRVTALAVNTIEKCLCLTMNMRSLKGKHEILEGHHHQSNQ